MSDGESVLTPEEGAAFARSVDQVRRSAGQHLSDRGRTAAAIAFVKSAQDGIDAVVADARRRGRRIDCASGCSHCCHARVEATPAEILLIAATLASSDGLLARLERHLHVAPAADAAWARRPACPFLVDRLCAIYPVRPAGCRKAHSTDVARCVAQAPLIPQDLSVALDAEALIVGTSLAYGDRGFDATPSELVSGVASVLRDPSLRERWLAGEPFA